MASVRMRVRDGNRFQKRYPYTRHPIRKQLFADKSVEIEVKQLAVSSQSSVDWEFDETFGSDPTVTATIVGTSGDSSSGNQSNINCFIYEVSTSKATIHFSAEFSGVVHAQAIYIPS